MPRKTVRRRIGAAPVPRGFNEAAARCRGKPNESDAVGAASRSLQ